MCRDFFRIEEFGKNCICTAQYLINDISSGEQTRFLSLFMPDLAISYSLIDKIVEKVEFLRNFK